MAKKNINFNTYVERDLTKTTVDWGTVASKLTNDLGVIRKERERKKRGGEGPICAAYK